MPAQTIRIDAGGVGLGGKKKTPTYLASFLERRSEHPSASARISTVWIVGEIRLLSIRDMAV